jgi:hypothetical protein
MAAAINHQWEYKLISSYDVPGAGGMFNDTRTREQLEAFLNRLGEEGWEIINVDFADQALKEVRYFSAMAKRRTS